MGRHEFASLPAPVDTHPICEIIFAAPLSLIIRRMPKNRA
jgi:hypothetical protein